MELVLASLLDDWLLCILLDLRILLSPNNMNLSQLDKRLNYSGYSCISTLRHLKVLKILIKKVI